MDGASDASGTKALREFLRGCRTDWGPRDLRAALRKLSGIGVDSVADLLLRVRQGTLNDNLEASGEKRFAADTLELIRIQGGLAKDDLPSSPRKSCASDEEDDDTCFSPVDTMDAFLLEADAETAARRQYASLQRDICRGLDQLRSMAAESRRQNEEFATAARVSEKVNTALRYRAETQRASKGRRPSSIGGGLGANRRMTSASAPPRDSDPPTETPASSRAVPPGVSATGCQRKGATSTRGAAPPMEPRPCPRAEQSGFTFGQAQQRRDAFQGTRTGARENSSKNSLPQPPIRGPSTEESGLRDALRLQLQAASGLSEAEKRAHVKRLLVQWHPDRNPDNVEVSTAAFQYIQQEKTRLLGLS